MAFVKTEKYFVRKIENVLSAIEGTRKALEAHRREGDTRAVAAHEAQLASQKRSLSRTLEEYGAFK